MLFLSPVPHGEVEDDTGKEATFSHTEEKACGEEARHVLGHAQQGCHYAPDECEGRKPYFRGGQFESDVAWDLCGLVDHVKLII